MSRPFRVKLSDVLSADGLTWKLVLGFAVCQLISIAFSKAPGQSLDRFLTAQLSCTFVYFISAYAFSRPGVAQRWALVLAISAFVVCGLGMWEWRLQHVPWLGHIPAFLKISDDVVDAILRGGARSADGVYRVQGIFTNSLAFAEFNALTVPFLVYGFRANRNPYVRTAILAGVILLVFAIMMSGSRLGAVGTLVGLLVYVAIWAYQLYRTRPQNLIAPAVLFSYPILALGAVASTFLIHGIRIHVWGNGVQQASNDSRIQQYRMGIPLVLKAPWGHGVGQCAVVLGFYEPSGLLTIDSYYLAVALDDGVMGFLVFYGLLSYAALKGVTRAIRSPAPQSDIELGLPAGIAILAFIIIKSVFSQLDNNSLVYMMLGLLTAMSYKASRADAAKAGHHLASKGRST